MSDDVGCGPAVGIVEIRTAKCCVEVHEVCDVAEAVICEELCELAVDASVFDAGFDVLHVFVAEDLPDVLALDSFSVNLSAIGVGEVVVVVRDAVVVDAGEVIDFPVRKNVLVVPEFGFVLVGGCERDINVVLKEGLCAWREVSVTTMLVAGAFGEGFEVLVNGAGKAEAAGDAMLKLANRHRSGSRTSDNLLNRRWR
jgi:hypothetical protein